jgi:hypothetical protein
MKSKLEILYEALDKHEIDYDKDMYIDDDERTFVAIEEAMELYALQTSN